MIFLITQKIYHPSRDKLGFINRLLFLTMPTHTFVYTRLISRDDSCCLNFLHDPAYRTIYLCMYVQTDNT